MAEFQELLDFPPAPKLGIDGKLDPAKATQSEMRGPVRFTLSRVGPMIARDA